MNGLPSHYTPGIYTAAPGEDGFVVCSPDGQARGSAFTTEHGAQTRADEFNAIRRRLAGNITTTGER